MIELDFLVSTITVLAARAMIMHRCAFAVARMIVWVVRDIAIRYAPCYTTAIQALLAREVQGRADGRRVWGVDDGRCLLRRELRFQPILG
jgi:hypothetical protein